MTFTHANTTETTVIWWFEGKCFAHFVSHLSSQTECLVSSMGRLIGAGNGHFPSKITGNGLLQNELRMDFDIYI